ncbi:MAG: hypothetical protein LBI20_03460 [Holosporales bacterium]|jgi:hypothetical protein|nr:hypothetical protein [Holosporales bacterium]
MVNGIKNTLIVCLTILVACVLFISYNEYTNRYALVATKDNSLYIFDKKSAMLNKCSDNGCTLIETKFPTKVFSPWPDSLPSKLFDAQKNMADELIQKNMPEELIKTDAVKKDPPTTQNEPKEQKKPESETSPANSANKVSETTNKEEKGEKPEEKKTEEKKQPEAEFVE